MMFRSQCGRWLSTTVLLITFSLRLQVVFMQDFDLEANECPNGGHENRTIHAHKYFKVHNNSMTHVLFDPVLCPKNSKSYELLKVKTHHHKNQDDIDVLEFWNETAILLRIPQSSRLTNYSREHEICMNVYYINKCNDSSHFEEHIDISLKLRPLFIQLKVSSGELVEGRPLNLTCSVLGDIKNKDNISIKYKSSVASIDDTDCHSGDTSACSFKANHSISCSCVVNAHTNLSDSGQYSCDVSIGDTTALSSDEENLEVKRDYSKTIIVASSAGGALILLAVVVIMSIIIVRVIKKLRRVPPHPIQVANGYNNFGAQGHPHANRAIGRNRVRNWNNEIDGLANNQRFNENLDKRRPGSAFPGSNRRHDEARRLLEERGYESAF